MHEITSIQLPKCNNQRAPLLIQVKGQDTDSRYVEICPKILLDEIPALVQALKAILDNQRAIAEEKEVDGENQGESDDEKAGTVQFTRDPKWIGRKVRLKDGSIETIASFGLSPDYVVLDNGDTYYPNGHYYKGDSPSVIDIVEVLPED